MDWAKSASEAFKKGDLDLLKISIDLAIFSSEEVVFSLSFDGSLVNSVVELIVENCELTTSVVGIEILSGTDAQGVTVVFSWFSFSSELVVIIVESDDLKANINL